MIQYKYRRKFCVVFPINFNLFSGAARFCGPTSARESQTSVAMIQIQHQGDWNAGSWDRGTETEGNHWASEIPRSDILWSSVPET